MSDIQQTKSDVAAPPQGMLFQADAARDTAGAQRTLQAAARHAGMRLCVLGSGSGGNATVVHCGEDALLIDAGFGPVTIARRLDQAGLKLEDVRGVCLTHLDQDHFRPHMVRTLLGYRIPVFIHQWHLRDFEALSGSTDMLSAGLVRVFGDDVFEPIEGLAMSPVRLAHDTKGTTGFRGTSKWGSFGYATDLGHVPAELVTRFAGVDLLAIECNYDPPMQLRSSRPLFLKRRIMGGQGHLSNQEAFEAVLRIDANSPTGSPRDVVLLHRSQQCNTPSKVLEVFAQSPELIDRVTLTHQRRRTRWFKIAAAPASERAQLDLGFGADA